MHFRFFFFFFFFFLMILFLFVLTCDLMGVNISKDTPTNRSQKVWNLSWIFISRSSTNAIGIFEILKIVILATVIFRFINMRPNESENFKMLTHRKNLSLNFNSFLPLAKSNAISTLGPTYLHSPVLGLICRHLQMHYSGLNTGSYNRQLWYFPVTSVET